MINTICLLTSTEENSLMIQLIFICVYKNSKMANFKNFKIKYKKITAITTTACLMI